ncbi:MAG: DUF3343 domain-containing protein [Oscillospiraceae bacterium]|jgi:hypothetical protein|nr:DUF3343 domain-containing protein [Oscillospiraceae bacterium]
MTQYIATFHTHLAALKTHRSLQKVGVEARMAPVPRKISSSCGTCVFYRAETPCYGHIDPDAEAVYETEGDKVQILRVFEE